MQNISESTLRDFARRHGYRVAKSRRDGTYGAYDAHTGMLVLGDRDGHGYGLADIREHLLRIV